MVVNVVYERPLDLTYTLSDNLTRENGRIFLTGTQALVRLLLTQRRLDRARGLNTAGFVSGYRGSPLGGVDMALWKAQKTLEANQIQFIPGINEDLAATAVMGTQQAGGRADRCVDGVFALWYGKGPGVDRAGDALHHGNAAGASRHGGVLVVVGDDHTAVSSSIPHASEASLIGWQMPIVHPSSVEEYETFALWGWALSRYAGTWVAFKAVSETVECGHSFVPAPTIDYTAPNDPLLPPEQLAYSARDFLSPAIETRMALRMRAVTAFARQHSIDQLVCPAPHAVVGIITVGKAHLDTLEALSRLGLDTCSDQALVRVYKPGLTWPLETTRLRAFAQGLTHILVIEEKGPIVENQVKDWLFNQAQHPSVVGKRDWNDAPFIPATGQLRPSLLAAPLTAWLARTINLRVPHDAHTFDYPTPLTNDADDLRRRPYFCSGCPHSTSTRVPAGSQALSGVGCHYMAAWMDRDTSGLTQMGGEGVDWVGLSRYTTQKHVFQNMGEGTYYHSGYLAIRQAVAARANITYKILFNDAVAMTGGQPVDGPISVPQICQQLRGENVVRIVVTTDEPEKYRGVSLGDGIQVHHRRELDALQQSLRQTPGVTVLIHDQTCAAEKRRRRKQRTLADPARRLFINPAVCEGCGDCGTQSNCLSIVPLETPNGRKRAIDQSSCNKDYSCAEGFCPSFVSVIGGHIKPRTSQADHPPLTQSLAQLPDPVLPTLDAPYRLLVAGIGGTGVITIGAILSMAAHLEGLSAAVLDLTGLAQKGGTVISHIRLAQAHAAPGPVRLDWQQADAAILCDPIAAMAPEALGTLRKGHTRVTVNTYVAPLSDFTRNPDLDLRTDALLAKIRHAAGDSHTTAIDAWASVQALFGDNILTNMFLLGHAWQLGSIPLSKAAIEHAIALNGVAVTANRAAFDAGRLAAHQPVTFAQSLPPQARVITLHRPESFEHLVARHIAELTAYQDANYARQYQQIVERVLARERVIVPGPGAPRLTLAVAQGLYKLMAYKDEYEVARLYTDATFQAQLQAQFGNGYQLRFHLAPPLFARKDPHTGIPRKITLGPYVLWLFKLLTRFKGLRGTWLDPFGYTAERQQERALISDYHRTIDTLLAGLTPQNLPAAIAIAALAQTIRGFGHVKIASIQTYQTTLQRLITHYQTPTKHAPPLQKIA